MAPFLDVPQSRLMPPQLLLIRGGSSQISEGVSQPLQKPPLVPRTSKESSPCEAAGCADTQLQRPRGTARLHYNTRGTPCVSRACLRGGKNGSHGGGGKGQCSPYKALHCTLVGYEETYLGQAARTLVSVTQQTRAAEASHASLLTDQDDCTSKHPAQRARRPERVCLHRAWDVGQLKPPSALRGGCSPPKDKRPVLCILTLATSVRPAPAAAKNQLC